MLLPPRLLSQNADSSDNGLECSVHTLPKPLMREFHHVFGDQYLHVGNGGGELLAIPTNQHAREDLVGIGDHIEQEKDRLLNVVCVVCFVCCFLIHTNIYTCLIQQQQPKHTHLPMRMYVYIYI